MNQHTANHDEFIRVVNTLKELSQTISREQRIGLLQQAVQQFGLSAAEADEILKDSGLIVGESVNYFEVLGFSVDEFENRDETFILTRVEAAHKEHYSASLQAGGLPRPDGRTQEQWRTVLNQARDTLKDPQKRMEHIAILQTEIAAEFRTPVPEESPTAEQTSLDDADAVNNRGLAKRNLGQRVAAIAYNIAIRLRPDFANAYCGRGLMKAELGEHIAAILDYDIAIELEPDYADAYYNRGNAKAELGEHGAAIADYDIAIRLRPDNSDAYYNRGNAKAELGEHGAAIADYDITIELDPDYANAYCARGVTKGQLGQYFAAISDFDAAIRLKRGFANAYCGRGFAKAELGEHIAAISDYDIAIRLRPDFAAAYYNRGNAKDTLGRPSEAKAGCPHCPETR